MDTALDAEKIKDPKNEEDGAATNQKKFVSQPTNEQLYTTAIVYPVNLPFSQVESSTENVPVDVAPTEVLKTITVSKKEQLEYEKKWLENGGEVVDQEPTYQRPTNDHVPKNGMLTTEHCNKFLNICTNNQIKVSEGIHLEYTENIVNKRIIKPPANIHNFLAITPVHKIHSALITNIPCCPGFIYVYDSQFTHVDDKDLIQTTAVMRKHMGEEEFTIKWIKVQQQDGDTDCVLFSIANATAVLLGKNPHEYR